MGAVDISDSLQQEFKGDQDGGRPFFEHVFTAKQLKMEQSSPGVRSGMATMGVHKPFNLQQVEAQKGSEVQAVQDLQDR